MGIGEGRPGDSGAAGTLRGVAFIVIAGVALGVMYNTLGLASRPARGLSWIRHPEEMTSLESLQPPVPHVGAAAESVARAPATPPAVALVAPAPAAAAERDARPAGRATTEKPAAAPATTHAPASSRPASDRPAAPPANPPAPAASAATAPAATGDLPVIPDLPRPIKVELASLKKLYDAGAVLVVDAREADEYRDGHIAGALGLSYNDAMAEPERMQRMGENGRPIAVYCSGGSCDLSMNLAKLMLENGRKRVLVYEGGFPEWQAAGYPVATGPQPGGR